MDNLIHKIEGIQNRQQSLMWGHFMHSDHEVMFAVGNKAYKRENHFFLVSETFSVYLIDENHKPVLFKQCDDEAAVATIVISLLKEWFPARGNAENNQ